MKRIIVFVALLNCLSSVILAQTASKPQVPAQKSAPANVAAVPRVEIPECVAEINGEKIFKNQLAAEVLRQFGDNVLRDEIRKALIMLECQKHGITVSPADLQAEVQRLAGTFKRDTEQWFEMIEKERGMSRSEYIEDLLRPMLSMIKLAGQMMTVTDDEVRREFDARFGESIQVRQIVFTSQELAEQTRRQLLANPDSFASVAKNISADPTTKPYGGLLPPIRRLAVEKVVGDTIFALKDGEISSVVQWPIGHFVLFRCEQHFPPQQVDFAAYRPQLEQKVRDAKIREVSEQVFANLMKNAHITNVMVNPALASQYPDVAAVVNGYQITRQQLADKCIRRYGKITLGEMIGKKMIEQECRKNGIQLTQGDIENEIREMAAKNLPLKPDNTPNTERWLELATKEVGVTPDVYRANTVWPMLALKRLSRDGVKVTEEDVRKGFEANFGAKVKCRAIIMDNQRRAHEVWDKATKNPTVENFADLAQNYSVDESRINGGIIPPIQKHGGQPMLEKEAFSLRPGEISQIIQDEDVWVFLFCEGYTPPVNVNMQDVQTEIVSDIYDKKLKLAIANKFEEMSARSTIDNYLENTSTSPRQQELPNANQPPEQRAAGAALPRK
ncbi:MAG: peptidylprolyl isomerase [Planctomycetaceae bacterium]|nr:peptidylprolyl isomerase [Planctomycetaceae bacterium]